MESIRNPLIVEFYRGDTLENLQTCVVNKRGRLFFDKSRESGYRSEEIFATRNGVAEAFTYALISAHKLGHTPVVISGRFWTFSKVIRDSNQYWSNISFQKETLFPLNRVWLPKSDFNWSELKPPFPEWLYDNKKVESFLKLSGLSRLIGNIK